MWNTLSNQKDDRQTNLKNIWQNEDTSLSKHMTPLSKKGTVQDSSCQSLLLYAVIKLQTVIVPFYTERP